MINGRGFVVSENSVKVKIKKREKYLFEDYDVEASYMNNLENLSESFVDSVFSKSRYKVNYMTKTIEAGNQFEVEIYPVFKSSRDLPDGIVTKKKETRQAQKNLNDANSRKKLTRLVHANFGPGDYWITLTFSDEHLPKDFKEMEKIRKNFFGKINRLRKKKGLENARYIYVEEEGTYGTERYHIHLVMDSDLSKEEVESKWTWGRTNIRTINYNGDESLRGLCNYMTKDPKTYKKMSFRTKGKRTWGRSKGNLKEPIERKNKTKFSRKKVLDMAKHRDSIEGILNKSYPGRQFKEVEVRYNDYNGLFYIYAIMHDKRNTKARR